jgi:peptidoglycan/LPS O-acetylase OafA/YrhL
LPQTEQDLRAVRLHSVDVLRAVAALSVMWFHMPPMGGGFVHSVQRVGSTGVGLFLVLSGFAIHYVWASRGDTSDFRLGAFWQRRLWRLYPTYVVAVLLAVAYAVATSDVDRLTTRYWALDGGEIPVFVLLVSQVLLVTAGIVPVPFIEVAWTLGLELQLYAAYSAFIRRLRAIGPVRLVAIALAVSLLWRTGGQLAVNGGPPDAVTGPSSVHEDHLFLLGQLPGRWAEWMLGLLAAEAWFGRVRLPAWTRQPLLGLAIVVGGLYMIHHPFGGVSLGGRGFVLSETLRDPLLGVGFFILLNAFTQLELRRPQLLETRPLAALATVGLFSYSLYLLHVMAISAWGHVARVDDPKPAWWFLGAAAAAIGSAYVFFRLWEIRFLRKPPQRRAERTPSQP